MSQENEKSLRLKNQLEEALKPIYHKLESLEKEIKSIRSEQKELIKKLED